MGRIVVLSLTASLNPTLVGATTVMLLLPRPARLMGGYLAGAYITSITLGLVIVFGLSDAGVTSTTKRTVSPATDIALGLIMVGLAAFVRSGRPQQLAAHRRERHERHGKEPPRWQRQLSKGTARTTFVVGALLTLPGASYIAGLVSIHNLNDSTPVTVLLVIGFNLVMLWLLEVPFLAFLLAPETTPQRVERAKEWGRRHAFMLAVRGLAVLGLLLILKGVAAAIL